MFVKENNLKFHTIITVLYDISCKLELYVPVELRVQSSSHIIIMKIPKYCNFIYKELYLNFHKLYRQSL